MDQEALRKAVTDTLYLRNTFESRGWRCERYRRCTGSDSLGIPVCALLRDRSTFPASKGWELDGCSCALMEHFLK